MRPSFAIDCHPPKNKRVRGKPGARCTRGLVCQKNRTWRTRAYRSSGEHPAFPAQWFYGLYAISPVSRALLPPSPPRNFLRNLAPASGARTTRFRRTLVPRASSAAPASTASHRAFRDDREPPLSSGETRGIWTDLPFLKIRIFLRQGLDWFLVICPSRLGKKSPLIERGRLGWSN